MVGLSHGPKGEVPKFGPGKVISVAGRCSGQASKNGAAVGMSARRLPQTARECTSTALTVPSLVAMSHGPRSEVPVSCGWLDWFYGTRKNKPTKLGPDDAGSDPGQDLGSLYGLMQEEREELAWQDVLKAGKHKLHAALSKYSFGLPERIQPKTGQDFKILNAWSLHVAIRVTQTDPGITDTERQSRVDRDRQVLQERYQAFQKDIAYMVALLDECLQWQRVLTSRSLPADLTKYAVLLATNNKTHRNAMSDYEVDWRSYWSAHVMLAALPGMRAALLLRKVLPNSSDKDTVDLFKMYKKAKEDALKKSPLLKTDIVLEDMKKTLSTIVPSALRPTQ